MPIPKSVSKATKQKMLENLIYPMVKPDMDNINKAILDGLNGVAYTDDVQVVSLQSKKVYEVAGGVLVTISSLNEERG